MTLSKSAKTQSNNKSKRHNEYQILKDLESYQFKSINKTLSIFDLFCLNLLFRNDGIIYDLMKEVMYNNHFTD